MHEPTYIHVKTMYLSLRQNQVCIVINLVAQKFYACKKSSSIYLNFNKPSLSNQSRVVDRSEYVNMISKRAERRLFKALFSSILSFLRF